ncbi:MAG: hypothetical protein Q6370_014850, partial [Candidatus Sigynarchaeota archaeon]
MRVQIVKLRDQAIPYIVLSMMLFVALSTLESMQNRAGGSNQCLGTVMSPSAIEGTSKPLAIMQQATVTRSFYPLSLPT